MFIIHLLFFISSLFPVLTFPNDSFINLENRQEALHCYSSNYNNKVIVVSLKYDPFTHPSSLILGILVMNSWGFL